MSDPKRLGGGLTERAGIYDGDGFARAADILDRVRAEGLETIRLSFADQHGVLRGKTVVAEALEGVFRSGLNMTSTLLLKDTSHRTVFPVWDGGPGLGEGRLDGAGDVLILPDPDTFRILPWSTKNGWMLCDVRYVDGQAMPFCTRTLLKGAIDGLDAGGCALTVGLEIEFHVHRVTDPRVSHEDAGMPGAPPETELLFHGYQYLTEARYDVLEPAMDAIRKSAQALDIPVRSMEVEFGPSQAEMTFAPAGAVQTADAMILFRAAAKETCRRMGLHASFMTRPNLPGVVPSGWHIHQSLGDRSGRNLFQSDTGELTAEASGWIAGLLQHASAACLLTTPTVNGYKRFQPGMLAPDRIQWARDNKGAMLRSLVRAGDPASRIENRVAEPCANPYLALAAQIHAGLDGLTRGLKPPEPVNDPYLSDAPRLPGNLGAAIQAFEAAPLWQGAFGEEAVRWLATIKRAEWDRYLSTVSEWEHREYYGLF